jgi:hydroxymethylpyrimidine pyrophosphatase-like HAD family hydrolase
MKYKAIILDLDGTTVHVGTFEPNNRVSMAIQEAQKYVTVCIATGRPLVIAKPIIQKLNITGICSVHDSTQLYDAGKDTVVDTVSLDHEIADSAYAIIRKYNFPVVMIGLGESENVYTGEPWPKELSDIAIPDMPELTADALIAELSRIPGAAIHKNVSFKKELFWVSTVSATATKLHAVVRIAELLGIETKEIIGVGDSYNDFPLLEACGLKIAMGNAVPELKAIADFIAPSVEDDGVAMVIEKFILNI